MNKTLTLLTVALFVTGCASTQYEPSMTPLEAQLAAKAQYYENQRPSEDRDSIEEVK